MNSKPNKPSAFLSKRLREILRFTVMEYIAHAKAVSSRVLSQTHLSELSSATIRSGLGQLEELGLLHQPHPSAGRIPTEDGFRYYLDHLLEFHDLTEEEKTLLKNQFDQKKHPIPSLRQASQFLSHYSQQIGMITSPRLEKIVFKQIQFVRISEEKILALFIAKNGFIEERIVQWDNAPSQDELWKMAKYLNEQLSDLPLKEVRKRIQNQLQDERIRYHSLFSQALRLRDLFLDQNDELEIFIEGYSHLMTQPEFSGKEKLSNLLKTLEQKQLLLQILEAAERNPKDAAQIVMGDDLEEKEFSGLSFVTRWYGSEEKILGALAIAGPTRMDYCRIVPLVNFTAHTLSNIFTAKDKRE